MLTSESVPVASFRAMLPSKIALMKPERPILASENEMLEMLSKNSGIAITWNCNARKYVKENKLQLIWNSFHMPEEYVYLLTAKDIDYSIKNKNNLTAQEECFDDAIKLFLDQHTKIQNKWNNYAFTRMFFPCKKLPTDTLKFDNTGNFKAITANKCATVAINVANCPFNFQCIIQSTYHMWNKERKCWNEYNLPSNFKAKIEHCDKKILYHVCVKDPSVFVKFYDIYNGKYNEGYSIRPVW